MTLAASLQGPLIAAMALALVACTVPARAAETSYDVSAEGVYDTNVTRAQLRDDIRSDGYVTGHAAATLRWPLGDIDAVADAVALGAGLRAAQYVRFPRLSMVALEATAAWRRKLGVGLTAPWIAASAFAAHESYRETLRDSDRIALQLTAGRRFSERFDGSLGYVYDRRYAHHDDVLVPGISGAVWDVAGHTGFARIGHAFTDDWQVDAGYSYRRGDVVSTTHRNLAIFLASDAIAPSFAFGPDFYDYRLRGTTQTGTGTLSYALGDRSSLNFTYAYAFTRAVQGLEYQSHLVSASWVYRY